MRKKQKQVAFTEADMDFVTTNTVADLQRAGFEVVFDDHLQRPIRPLAMLQEWHNREEQA